MKTIYSCGECTACCKTHGVESIQKNPQSSCTFCVANQGCTIYADRPDECRSFKCSWLDGKGGGLEYRPDRTGVVPVHEFIPDIGESILILTEFNQGSLNSEFIFKWTQANLFRGYFTIHRPIHGNDRIYLPKGAENPTEEEHRFFEHYFQKKIDFIPFESFLSTLVL